MPIRIGERGTISPRIHLRRVHERDAPVCQRTVETVDIVDLEVERALRDRLRSLGEDDGEVVVTDGRDAGIGELELDFEPERRDVPIGRPLWSVTCRPR